MTGDELPTTPGSVAADHDGQRYALAQHFWGVKRWVPLTRWEKRSPDADELAARGAVVLFTAPVWEQDPGPPPVEVPG